ncbi:amino acid ABC transporter permease [Nocardioides sp. C4-1]|uniref:amino acid ABC transporter permease n=1 Tax=Nocardioides sp. C4-1 TaxID=3151851 RepID=UPI0032633413
MTSVLYDEPGPRARRRARIATVVGLLLILALVAVAVRRLDERGQFERELWAPLIDPSDETFPRVWELIGQGVVATLTAAGLAIAASIVVGILLGTARMLTGRAGRVPIVGFIELFRGLPVIITIVFVWRAFEELGIDIGFLPGDDGLWYLVIGLTLYNSVIIAEILRAGVQSLPSGQREAALAVGMSERTTMRLVLLPQAFRVMLPALISQLVVVLKDTSLAALVALYTETLRTGQRLYQTLDNPIQVLFVIGVLFIVVNYTLSKIAVWVERRLSRSTTTSGDAAAVKAAGGAGSIG